MKDIPKQGDKGGNPMKLKIALLRLLEENRDRDLSGEWLAKQSGVSRNAVWKAIKALQADGYRISAGENRGYRLSPENDTLSAGGIADAICNPLKGLSLYLHRRIDSTNDEAKRLIASGEKGMALVVAEGQTAGRGRQGKSFYSPEQTGVYMTLSLPTSLAFSDAVSVTTATAIAVHSAIYKLTGIETKIKWVNDLYLNGKKVCGILTEAVSDLETGMVQHMIIGIGLNWSTMSFPSDLQEIATSLAAPRDISRNRMIAAVVDALFDTLKNDRSANLALYRRHSMVLGKEITYLKNGEGFHARAIDIDENGGLVVEHTDGSRITLQSGEISLRVDKT